VSGFLDQMALGSRERARAAMMVEPLQALRAHCRDLPPPAALVRAGGFDLIAELKLRSPALGDLGTAGDDPGARVMAYARAGAAAVSVLTEPSRFAGSLDHLRAAATALAPLGVPAMRKDFLVDPYQLYEARACGAGGALLIVRMLSRGLLTEMLDCARELGLFVLIEAFDEEDIAVAIEVLATAGPASGERGGGRPPERASLACEAKRSRASGAGDPADERPPGTGQPSLLPGSPRSLGKPTLARRGDPGRPRAALGSEPQDRAGCSTPGLETVLIGVNSRDLQTLQVVPQRLEQLAPLLPGDMPRVAESGLETADDAARMVRAGYDMALVGGALMSAPDPGALVSAMLAAGRAAAA
jgi:indole-3-glycerol phosphate synthase